MSIKYSIANFLFRVVQASPNFRSRIDELIKLRVNDAILSQKAKLNEKSQPGLGVLWDETKDIDLLRWDVKVLGLEVARMLYSEKSDRALSEMDEVLVSSLCKQNDFSKSWFKHWCHELHIEPILHRKIWEYAFVLQVLNGAEKLRGGMSGLGFGCGQEPIASYFASLGINTTVTDLAPEQSENLGWVETGQHTSSLEQAYYSDIVERAGFDKYVKLDYVDMNNIPRNYDGKYDFCWSICAMEHLGSIRQGLDFVKSSTHSLKPGGIAVHTTEFNLSEGRTIDNWQTVLFQAAHLKVLSEELTAIGCTMSPLDANPGEAFLDKFIDLPPYNWEKLMKLEESAHLKLAIDGFPSTCVGIIVRKN